MSVEKVHRATGEVVWRVRWRQHGHNGARAFSSGRDARDFDAEVRRQRRAGNLAELDAGTETLGDYVTPFGTRVRLTKAAAWLPENKKVLFCRTFK